MKASKTAADPKASTEPTLPRAAGRKVAAHDAPPNLLSGAARNEMIATAAYFSAERRGFAPGDELADWLAAEAEIDRTLSASLRA